MTLKASYLPYVHWLPLKWQNDVIGTMIDLIKSKILLTIEKGVKNDTRKMDTQTTLLN